MNGGGFLRNAWFRLVIIFDIFLLLIILVVAFLNARKSSVLTLNIAPLDAEILVNGEGYANGSYSLAPGAYEIKISRQDLDSKTLNINLESGHNLTVAAFLKSDEDDFTFYTLKGNYSSFLKLEEIAAAENNLTYDSDSSAETFIKTFRTNYDLMFSALPIEHQEYQNTIDGRELTKDITIKVNYDTDCETLLCLKALILGSDKNFADTLLKEKGLKAEDYEIYYKIY